jgi:hypothetical protein
MKCRTCGKYLDPFEDDTLGEFCWDHSMSNPKNKAVKSEPAEGAEVYYPLSFITDALSSETEQQTTVEGAEEIIKSYEDKYEFTLHWLEKDRTVRMMQEFAALAVAEATKDCYPKEFVEWAMTDDLVRTEDGLYYFGPTAAMADMSLDELFDYWLKNIKQ